MKLNSDPTGQSSCGSGNFYAMRIAAEVAAVAASDFHDHKIEYMVWCSGRCMSYES